ncbi:hypothetical protein FRB94_004608 [Tulasnella sp. JGI-2019a]|nr:hypothetical protein FRB94_004608 [Tulasnella sp. JGI-2019a]
MNNELLTMHIRTPFSSLAEVKVYFQGADPATTIRISTDHDGIHGSQSCTTRSVQRWEDLAWKTGREAGLRCSHIKSCVISSSCEKHQYTHIEMLTKRGSRYVYIYIYGWNR